MICDIFPVIACEKVGNQKKLLALEEDDPMYCCYKWQRYVLTDPRVPITYNPQMRFFYVMVEEDTPFVQNLERCLLCNKKWPKCLVEEWVRTIKKEWAFDPTYGKNDWRIPDEFRTDEWWKNRGSTVLNTRTLKVETAKKKKNVLPKRTVYSKIFGKELTMLDPDHPMYCCQDFQDGILYDRNIPITYHPQYRFYYLITPKREPSTHIIRRCIYCGKKWPKELWKEFFKELGKVVGYKIVYTEYDWSTLPEEFKSEEWWRKRGL
jgi:hypothetical protein